MLAIRIAAIAAFALPALAHAQIDPNNIPIPPTAELMRLRPFLGSYSVTGTYAGQQWAGSLDLVPAVKGWYVEWEINVHSGPIDRQLRMLITWDRETEKYRIWRFETSPPDPRDRAEGTGRFEGGEFVMEWKMPTPDGQPGIIRNRLRLEGSDVLVITSVVERTSGPGGIVQIGVTTARRRMWPGATGPENEEAIVMRLRHSSSVFGLTALLAAVAGACGSMSGESVAREQQATPLEQRGETLFTEETFDGNGRVCSTCHELDQFGTITPEFVQAQFELDPEGPLFREIDSDDGRGGSYRRLLEHATIRVPRTTPYDEVLGRAIRRCARPASTSALVFRGNPTVFNAALEEVLMHDGRERGDLEIQASNAIDTHAEPGRKPAPEEMTAMARFQEALFSHTALKEFLDSGTELRLPDGNTPAEIRGRIFFQPNRQCGICHSGPLLNRTSEFHPDSEGARIESTSVGAEPDNPNPKYEWCFVDPVTNKISPPAGLPLEDAPDYVKNGRIFRRAVADPGIALIRDSSTDFPFTFPDGTEVTATSALLSAIVGLPFFKIPTLWGSPNTAPYFHDNSARNLDEVMDHYNFMFREDFAEFAARLGCDPEATECLSEQDRADIIAFMQLLSFEGHGIRPDTSR